MASDNNNKRILHLITGLNTGGAEMMLYKISKYRSRKIEYKVLSLTTLGPISDKIRSTGVPVESLGLTKNPISLLKAFKLFKIINMFKPDIIQTWLYHSDLIGAIAGLITNTPVYWNIRQEKVSLKLNKWSTVAVFKLCSFLSFVPKRIISCSKRAQEFHIENGFSKDKFELVYNGFELDAFTPPSTGQLKENFEKKLVIHVGRYAPLKNQIGFIEVASKIKDQIPEAVFEMYGDNVDNKNPYLDQAIKKHKNLQGSIFLRGRTDSPQELYKKSSLLISTSFSEGFSNTIGEAMASALPVIGTFAGDTEFIIDNDKLVFQPTDYIGIAGEASRIMKDFNTFSHISGEARNKIEERFNITEITKKYESLYNEANT